MGINLRLTMRRDTATRLARTVSRQQSIANGGGGAQKLPTSVEIIATGVDFRP